jgi:hypothetical protein
MKSLLFIPAALAAACSSGFAQESFTLGWSSLSGGGGALHAKGEFTLAGSSVGQFSAGEATGEAGEFTVSGGYWTFEFEPPDLHLAMQLDGGTVTLTWDAGVPADGAGTLR